MHVEESRGSSVEMRKDGLQTLRAHRRLLEELSHVLPRMQTGHSLDGIRKVSSN